MMNWKKIIAGVLIAMVAYSFLPLISFWFVKGADIEDNNEANVAKLAGNEGVYFSFIVFGDNHSGLILNDAATLKLIWHMNREDRFKKIPIDFVLSVGDVTLDGKLSHFYAFKKIQRLIKWPLIVAIGNHDDRELFGEFCGKEEFAFYS